MSKIRFTCPHCDNLLTLPAAVAGKVGACPRCGETINVPEASSQPESPPESEEEPATEIPTKPNWFGGAGGEASERASDAPDDEQTVFFEPADDEDVEPSESSADESPAKTPALERSVPERSPGRREAHDSGGMQWYVFNGQQDVGPMSIEHLLEGVEKRHVQPGNLVTKDLKIWVRAADIDWLDFPNPLMP
jgi:hypothetical protein